MRISSVVVFFCCFSFAVFGQMAGTLATSDTRLMLEAGLAGPRLVSLSMPGLPEWKNRTAESLIDSVEVDGKKITVAWAFNRKASRSDDQQVVFVYDSATPPLRLSWEWRAPETYGPIEHAIRIENLGSREIWIPMQDSLDLDWSVDAGIPLKHVFVEKGANTPSAVGTHEVAMTNGYDWVGTSSTYGDLRENEPREIIPWSLIQRSSAAQDGWYAGIEFSGRTRIALQRGRDSLSGALGLNPQPGLFRTRLRPGETFETPIVFLGGFRGGIDGEGNSLRKWVRAVLGNPETWKDPKYPLVVNNSWGGGMDVNEHIARRMIADSAELGMEMFHLDAGWFRGVGDWYPNLRKFPHGLGVITDDAHQQGLKFGLWIDWAQAGLSSEPAALNARDPKVRDWMVTDVPADWQPEPFKGQTIDIGIPDAERWVERELERVIGDYRLDMLEHDGYLVAHGCDRKDHPHAAPDPLNECVYKSSGFYFVDSSNSTDVSYHAVRAYYDIYSRLRREHPGLLFEICNDGGRMVDFGSAAHGDYFSMTDTYDPLSNRRAFYDASHVLPPAMLESYVEKWPAPRIENFRYMLRSGMMGWLSVMQDTSAWSAEQHVAAKEEIELYKKELRPLIRDGELYHVSARPDGVHWDGIEYWDPMRKRAAVYAFRGSSESEKSYWFLLRGLNPRARYRVTFHDHSSADRELSGRDLMVRGLKVLLPVSNSSEIVLLEQRE